MGAIEFAKLPHIGESVLRKEDYRFLTGAGQYTDDITLTRMSHAVFVRSPHAHANIKSVNTSAAKAAPGVIGVLEGKDVANDKLNGLPCGWLITSTDGQPMKEPPHPVLALDKVRYVGDHVVMVVAETLEQAKNAAELVEVDYDPLPAAVDVRDANGGPTLHDLSLIHI
jgi:carbon-monoxide dehydrogenase large subunit